MVFCAWMLRIGGLRKRSSDLTCIGLIFFRILSGIQIKKLFWLSINAEKTPEQNMRGVFSLIFAQNSKKSGFSNFIGHKHQNKCTNSANSYWWLHKIQINITLVRKIFEKITFFRFFTQFSTKSYIMVTKGSNLHFVL